MSWTEARDLCEERGGNLAVITRDAEWNIIKAQHGNALNGLDIWIGGSDEEKEDEWKWVTGEPWQWPTRFLGRNVPGVPESELPDGW